MEVSTDLRTYHEAVGSLTYGAITIRPHIVYTAGLAGGFSANPSTLHCQAVKRILR